MPSVPPEIWVYKMQQSPVKRNLDHQGVTVISCPSVFSMTEWFFKAVSKQNFPMVKMELCVGMFEHNRATWQDCQPVELHLSAFRKLLYVCSAGNQEGECRKALKKKSLQSGTPSCNSEFPSNMLCKMKLNQTFLIFVFHSCFVVFLLKLDFIRWISEYNHLKCASCKIIFFLTEFSTEAFEAQFACVISSL